MSILIKGLEMPRDCPMCPLSHWNRLDEFTGCEVVNGKRFAVTTDEGYAQSDTRPIWCPLVEIPPHGDLIDMDNLIEDLGHLHDKRLAKWLIWLVNGSAVVIESEEGK